MTFHQDSNILAKRNSIPPNDPNCIINSIRKDIDMKAAL